MSRYITARIIINQRSDIVDTLVVSSTLQVNKSIPHFRMLARVQRDKRNRCVRCESEFKMRKDGDSLAAGHAGEAACRPADKL